MENQNRNEVCEGYKALTYADAEKIGELNHKNQWGITRDELRELGKKHAAARAKNDVRTMEKIEYRLEDINFHYECALLCRGEYEAYMSEVEA